MNKKKNCRPFSGLDIFFLYEMRQMYTKACPSVPGAGSVVLRFIYQKVAQINLSCSSVSLLSKKAALFLYQVGCLIRFIKISNAILESV